MVGLVEHGDLDGVETAVTVADVLLESARAGDDDVDTGLQRRDLGLGADPTEDGDRP